MVEGLSLKSIYRLIALCLLVTIGYIQGVQLIHAYHHNDNTKQTSHTSFQVKKEINCKICDYLHVKQGQQLPGQLFTLSEVYRSKPILIQRLDLAIPFEIPLSSYFNKGPPLA
ncbi:MULTISPECIES: hypothetical protein [Sphingobacteriaceae]|jgi:hypothetical protein|uniref:DUF2946 domain-containing protein n=1 Tax=Sphingobacterium sp. (strain 21) TaxID=743722 RepID=F4CF00_SPHS2